MKKMKIGTILLAAIAAVMTGPCAAGAGSRTVSEIAKVPAEISEISIEAGNMVSLTFVKSVDTIATAEVKSDTRVANPVSVERRGSKLVVKVAGREDTSKPGSGRMTTSLKLHIPGWRNVTVLGRNLVISGELAAKNIRVRTMSLSMHFLKMSASNGVSVETGYGQLKFTLSSGRKLSVKGDILSGKIFVPASAEVVCRDNGELQIVRSVILAEK